MATEGSWPEHTFIDTNFKDVSQLAQVFELHCAKIYAHAANHPDHPASADYVRELVSQAYRAVHSLNMQNMASSCLDLEVAIATLDNKAKEYRQIPELSPPTHDAKPAEPELELTTETTEDHTGAGLKDILTGNFEDEDSEEDSDWDESESETDDEYYEYCSGSDAELDEDELEAVARTSTLQQIQQTQSLPQSTKTPIKEEKELEEENSAERTGAIQEEREEGEEESTLKEDSDTPSPPPVSIIQDQAMHDRITAALRTIPLPCHESELEEIPLARVEEPPLTRVLTHVPRPQTRSTVSPDDTQSEATAVQTESNHDNRQCTTSATAPAATTTTATAIGTRKTSFDAGRLHRKLSMRSSPANLPRRLKTVCYKYVRRAMVPIRGQSS